MNHVRQALPCLRFTRFYTTSLGQSPRVLLRPTHSCYKNVLPVGFHSSPCLQHLLDARDPKHDEKNKELTVQKGKVFDQAALLAKSRETYKKAIQIYTQRGDKYHRGHVEFIYAAMGRMKEFGVEKDLEMYKMLVEVFPKGKMIAQTVWQVEFMHYPKQQQCCIDLLDQLEDNGVVPDDAMGAQLIQVFGPKSHAFRKYQRVMYWLPKFRNMNPFPVPHILPLDPIELAVMALKRMAVDLENAVDVFKTSDLENAQDDTFVASAQSPTQQNLLASLPRDEPIYVEGGFDVWLRDHRQTHFILRSKVTPALTDYQEKLKKQDEDDEMFNWNLFEEEKTNLVLPPSAHEQEDGTILAMCITGTASKDSLVSWVNFLQETNPALAEIPVLFKLRSYGPQSEALEEGEIRTGALEHTGAS